jgi:GMP synthase-like glutamine amidotransferase
MRFHCLQHVYFESPGNIAAWINENQHELTYTKFFEKGPLPPPDDFDVLLIMGGHMSVHDEKEFPWLRQEKQWVADAIRKQKKILGICLGSQIIAETLGTKVYPNEEKEIGFMPVYFTETAKQHPYFNHFGEKSTVFHWHGETFDLPAGAVRLAYSTRCLNQAYLLNENIMGIQFHLEMTQDIIWEMVAHGEKELVPGSSFIHSAEKIGNDLPFIEHGKNQLYQLLDKFFKNPI